MSKADPFETWWNEKQDAGLWERARRNGTDVDLARADMMMRAAARQAWNAQQVVIDKLLAALKDVCENVKDDSPDMWVRAEDAIALAEGKQE